MRQAVPWREALAFAAVSLALWPVPVVGMVHAEGAAVLAFAGFFIAGGSVLGARSRGEAGPGAIRQPLAALVVPLVLLSATVLWRPNCGYLQGLGLFAILVPPSVLLGAGVGDVLAAWRVRKAGAWLGAIGLVLAVVPTVLVLKGNPQLFVYNPVFGGVLGPLYDAELAIRPGLFAHQAAVMVGAVGLLAAARWRRGAAMAGRVALLCSAVIAIVFGFSSALGITQSEAQVQRALSWERSDGRVTLHADPGSVPTARLAALLDEAAFRLAAAEAALGVRVDDPIHVYLYPDPETKAALLGSRETSVVPVWLPTPQIHLLEERADGDLGHEMIHVVAREVGDRWTGATWAIGLVEGLAVALEAPEGLPSPEQQTAAALRLPPERGGLSDPASAVVGAMSPLGFWTGRAGVSYTTTGAFVSWLLQTHGSAPVVAVYGGASWADAFGVPLRTLAEQWADHLRTVEPSAEAFAYAEWRFSLPSLFEVRCPHHVPEWDRLARTASDALEDGDLDEAARGYAAAAAASPDSLTSLLALSRYALATALGGQDVPGTPRAADYLAADPEGTLAQPRLLLAHAARLRGRPAGDSAVVRALPPYALQSRAVYRQLAALEPEALHHALRPAPDTTDALRAAQALSRGGHGLPAALRFHEAGRPEEAWIAMESALPWRGADSTDAATLDLLAARLAYAAGRLEAADSLASRSARFYLTAGREAPARLAFDLRERIAWRRRAGG